MTTRKKVAIAATSIAAIGTTVYLVVQPPSYTHHIVWKAGGISEPVVYEVWHTTNINEPFTPLNTNVTELSFGIYATNKMELFKVRARNTTNGLVSAWATTK